MFSDDLDKALATFVLANGAAATGQKVTIFFTFWGLNVIKKLHKPETKKDIFGKMFGMMLPSSSKKLKLSKMSMGGIGGKMMRYIMNKKGLIHWNPCASKRWKTVWNLLLARCQWT